MNDELLQRLIAAFQSPDAADYLPRFPSLPLWMRDRLPECAGVYFVMVEPGYYSATLQILYIGRSRNLRKRWRSHHRYDDAGRHDGSRIYWLYVDDGVDDDALSALELWCIAHFRPCYNNAPVPNVWRERFATLLAHTRRLEARLSQ